MTVTQELRIGAIGAQAAELFLKEYRRLDEDEVGRPVILEKDKAVHIAVQFAKDVVQLRKRVNYLRSALIGVTILYIINMGVAWL